MNTAIVPDTTERTRDLGVAEHSASRPPYAAGVEECARQLGDLERWFGTAVFADAVKHYLADADFNARERGLDPGGMVRDVEALYAGLELPAFVAGMVAKARALPVADPFPPAAPVPTQSTSTAVNAA